MYKTVRTAICAGREENPITGRDGIAQVIGFYARSQAVDDADIFVAENDLALQALVFPVVQVCAADAGEFLFEQDRSPVLGRERDIRVLQIFRRSSLRRVRCET